MRKATFRLLMLAAAMTLGLASCNNAEDNPVVMNPLAEQVKGLWWAMYPAEGTTGGKAYTQVGQALQLNEDGSAIQGLSYFERPIPENQNDSRTYSNGKTISVSGTLSGGLSQKQGANVNASVSCGATWTSTTSYTLNTVNYTLDTSSPTVKYHYYTSNVKVE